MLQNDGFDRFTKFIIDFDPYEASGAYRVVVVRRVDENVQLVVDRFLKEINLPLGVPDGDDFKCEIFYSQLGYGFVQWCGASGVGLPIGFFRHYLTPGLPGLLHTPCTKKIFTTYVFPLRFFICDAINKSECVFRNIFKWLSVVYPVTHFQHTILSVCIYNLIRIIIDHTKFFNSGTIPRIKHIITKFFCVL